MFKLILPIQAPEQAMPRAALQREQRALLSVAFAADTLTAVRRCPLDIDVVVVSPDARLQSLADDHDAAFVHAPADSSLNSVVNLALRCTRRPADEVVAALVSDLPALQHHEVRELLLTSGPRFNSVYTTDLGHGSITCHAERAATFESRLVDDTNQRYRPRGEKVTALLPGLRCDVDTQDGLRIANYLGVGQATQRAMAELGIHFPAQGTL